MRPTAGCLKVNTGWQQFGPIWNKNLFKQQRATHSGPHAEWIPIPDNTDTFGLCWNRKVQSIASARLVVGMLKFSTKCPVVVGTASERCKNLFPAYHPTAVASNCCRTECHCTDSGRTTLRERLSINCAVIKNSSVVNGACVVMALAHNSIHL